MRCSRKYDKECVILQHIFSNIDTPSTGIAGRYLPFLQHRYHHRLNTSTLSQTQTSTETTTQSTHTAFPYPSQTMHYTTLPILPILALVALTSAAPLPIEVYSSITPRIRTPNSDAAAVPIHMKRSAEDDLDNAWMGDFAKEKRSLKSAWDKFWDGDYVIV